MSVKVGPRFAAEGSFEFDYGQKWKQLHEMKRQRLEALEREMKLEEDKLVAQMEFTRYEHETERLRMELRAREESDITNAVATLAKGNFELRGKAGLTSGICGLLWSNVVGN